jgi:endonuclease YncB( thermonuclease family)
VIHSMAMRKCQIVLLLGALLIVACATVEAPGRATEQPEAIILGMGTTDGSCGTTLCCSNCPAIPVLRVIDGDTFTTSGNQRVRLFGVDTPERGEKCYREATDRLRQLAGGEVRVELGPRSKDRYGRLIYYAYTLDGDSIDEILVSEGLAKADQGDSLNLALGLLPVNTGRPEA